MISVSNAFNQELLKDNRDYLYEIRMTLDDGTVLNLTENDLWDGSVTFDEGTSSTTSFDLGGCVIGQCKIGLNNIYDKFSSYNFFNAVFNINIGLKLSNGSKEFIRKGIYTVNKADYNGSLITLTALDNMWKLDTEYSKITVSYPISASALVGRICTTCGVVLDNASFNNSSTSIPKPSDESEMNCREVLSYIGQMCCVYFKITPEGRLAVKWYDKDAILNSIDVDGGTYNTNTTPYSDGDNADGGNFTDYSSGDDVDGGTFLGLNDVAYLTSNSSMSVGTDNILITGVKTKKANGEKDDTFEYLSGKEGYVLVIENNPFVNKNNAQSIARQVANIVVGTVFRTFNSSTLSNPTYQAGDVCAINDFKGNRFYSFITNLTFTSGNYESFSCGAETPNQANTVRFSEAVRTAIEIARKEAVEKISNYDLAVQAMNTLASNAMGLRWAEVIDSSGNSIFYMSNKPITVSEDKSSATFTSGAKLWKMTGDGFFCCYSAKTTDSQCAWTNGFDSSGNAVINTLSTIGINFDWAYGGTLTLGGSNNGNGVLVVNDSSGTEIGRFDNSGIVIKKGRIELVQDDVFNRHMYIELSKSGLLVWNKSEDMQVNIGDGGILVSDGRYSSSIWQSDDEFTISAIGNDVRIRCSDFYMNSDKGYTGYIEVVKSYSTAYIDGYSVVTDFDTERMYVNNGIITD